MKKTVTKTLCLALSAMMTFSLVACGGSKNNGGKGEQKYNPEVRPVVFSTAELDGTFSPYFATTATDSNIAGMTQIGMLGTSSEGQVVWGKDEPVVTLDLKQTYVLSDGSTTQDSAKAAYTDYEFIIKKGIKYSDGTTLTINDVLFNLYVYLDPAYMGSSTIYSTDIVGLKAYRAQDPDLQDSSDTTDDELNQKFYSQADDRITNVLNHLGEPKKYPSNAQIEADIARAKELYKDEAAQDWTSIVGTQESYKERYSFTEDWQIYYYTQGVVKMQAQANTGLTMYKGIDANGDTILDDDGNIDFIYGEETAKAMLANGEITNYKYATSLDKGTPGYNNTLAKEIEDAIADEDKIDEYEKEYNCNTEEAIELIKKDTAIATVIDYRTGSNTDLAVTIAYYATGNNLRDEIAAKYRTDYFNNNKNDDGSMKVPDITGITTSTTTKDFSGKNIGEHDVLKIRINKVDPKAIWNFAFAVSPMHYYSNQDAIENTPHGVKFADNEFFTEVLQSPEKNGLPVGAGVYMASDERGSGNVTRSNFYSNKVVYFERNPYFYTVLGDGTDTSNNAKIKYLRYRVVGSSNLLNSLEAKTIDVGEPNAKPDTLTMIQGISYLNYETYETNGYGYVGINPKYVPDIEVRRAIMSAMNTGNIITYYTERLVNIINRPMSSTSWAYPKNATRYSNIAYNNGTDIENDMLAALAKSNAEVTKGSDGVYKVNGTRLEFTFTLAGDTTDHPAFQMFKEAAETLNEIGFKITVATDVQALSKLSKGGLAVWAAAWSSTIDPDLYQVYHKDSKATSIKNWGYTEIFKDAEQFGYEQGVIEALSTLIEKAREVISEAERAPLYAQALDKIMELAVEFPTYQRNDLFVYNSDVIDKSTLAAKPSSYTGVIDKMWELNYN